MKNFKDLLVELNACKEAVVWAGDMPIEEVVEKCHRGDWLLWLAAKIDIGLQPLTLAKGHCANTVRHLMEDERSIRAVDAAIDFGNGKITKEQLKAAAYDAYAAYAADADARAAYTAYAAARAAAYDAARAAAYDAQKQNRLQTADICRKYIGDLIIEKVNELLKQ